MQDTCLTQQPPSFSVPGLFLLRDPNTSKVAIPHVTFLLLSDHPAYSLQTSWLPPKVADHHTCCQFPRYFCFGPLLAARGILAAQS